MNFTVLTENDMQALGEKLAQQLTWPFCLELVGDVGAGKTTLVKGLARGLGASDVVSSPSFTINNQYNLLGGKVLSHYDFYRLSEGGLMSQSLSEDLADPNTAVVVEWGETIGAVLPAERYRLTIHYLETGRKVTLEEVKP